MARYSLFVLCLVSQLALAGPGHQTAKQASDATVNQFIELYQWEKKYKKILHKSMDDYIKRVRQAIKEKYPKKNPNKQLKEIRRVLNISLAWDRIHPAVKKEVKRSFPPRVLKIAINFKKEGSFRSAKDKEYMQSNFAKPAVKVTQLFLDFLKNELMREAVHISEIMDGHNS